MREGSGGGNAGSDVGPGALEVDIAGERLVLLPERAVYWPRRAMLLVADPHLGKAAAFRALGVPVPAGTTLAGLERLDAALARVHVTRVTFLGDFLHAREGRAPGTLEAFATWRRAHQHLDVVLVRGNHDRRAGDPPPELGIRCADPPVREAPFVLAHHPEPAADGYVLAGHLHPGLLLAGAGGVRLKLRCFWFGEGVGVLPAFGEFTGLDFIEPAATDRVFVVVDDAVVELAARDAASGSEPRPLG